MKSTGGKNPASHVKSFCIYREQGRFVNRGQRQSTTFFPDRKIKKSFHLLGSNAGVLTEVERTEVRKGLKKRKIESRGKIEKEDKRSKVATAPARHQEKIPR